MVLVKQSRKALKQPFASAIVKDHRPVLSCIFIAAITLIVFFPSLRNAFTNWDDDIYVTNNPDIRGFTPANVGKVFSSSYASNYQPLTMLTYMAEYSIGGLNPAVFHGTNLLLHIVNCMLVFALLYGLAGNIFIGVVVALLFAVHPLRVESVAWVAERKDVLSALFFFLSLLAYHAFLKKGIRKYYWICLLALVLSLLSKPMAISQPFILMLMDYLNNKKWDKQSFLQKIPFFTVAAVFITVTLITQRHSGAIPTYQPLPVLQRLCVPFYGAVFYIVKSLFPVKLAALYSMQSQQDIIMNSALIFASPFIVVGVAAAFYFCRTVSKMVVFGVLFFLITLLPVLQIVPVGSAIVADRYSYIPAIGLYGIVAGAIARIVNNRRGNITNRRTIVYAALVMLLFIFGILTFQRCKVWNSSLTLWNDTIAKYPSAIAYNNRGTVQSGPGSTDLALADFNRAIELDPAFAKAYNNRGIAYLTKGILDGALKDFNQTIELQRDFFDAYNNRGIVFVYLKEYDKAISDFTQALSINPGYTRAYTNRGIAYMTKGSFDLAIRDFDKVIAIDPHDPIAIEKRNQAIAGMRMIK